MDLATPVSKLPMVGPMYQRRLEKLNVYTLRDLLFHFPFRYEDFSLVSKIRDLQEGEIVTVRGKVVSIKNQFTRNRRFLQMAQVEDDTGTIDVVWFNQTYLTKTLPVGISVSLSGSVETYQRKPTLVAPAFEIIDSIDGETIHTGRLVPIYPETHGVSSKWLRAKIKQLLMTTKNELVEYLPKDIVSKNNLLPFTEAIEQIHFPKNNNDAQKARERLAFDEFFLMQLVNLVRKKEWEEKQRAQSLSIAKFKPQIEAFWEKLPFELTGAQKRAVGEIFLDLGSKKPMNRLLEGDVGSGKTVVAAIGMYVAVLNGYQAILMAPTQILAQQHYDTISKLLTPAGVNIGLITGTTKPKDKKGKFDILIGTHALLTKSITLDRLAYIVIDEQHRFGVEQRGLLLAKGGSLRPHILTMTATPIPRTVALTMYGDLDLSYLDEMPKGRVIVKTWVVPPEKREAAYEWIKRQKAQTFIICPFIEESESQVTVKAATKEYEHLKKDIFQKQNVGLLHGKMKVKDKEEAIDAFRNGKLDILVATPVVEVGIDIPSATVIIIEGSERFGLAQLHQLRGRVGRSNLQSYCLLFTDTVSENTVKRLKSLERIHVGAELAELDLQLRGPGDITGTKQHGIPKLKVAHFSDKLLIERTRREAERLISDNPSLSDASGLKEMLKTYTMQVVEPN